MAEIELLEALEAWLRTHPDDWDSWLVYADYLTEKGDDHGRLILLEHKLATSKLGPAERHRLESDIRHVVWRRWEGDGPLRPNEGVLEWHHGFLWSARLAGGTATAALQRLLQQPYAQFLGSLTLRGLTGRQLLHLPDLLDWTHLHTLILIGSPLTAELLAEILDEVRELQHLQLSFDRLGPEEALVLASCENLRGLRSLDLWSNALGHEGIAALAQAETLGGLTDLKLGFNGIDANGARELARSRNLQNLRSLDLEGNLLGDEGVEHLASSENLQGLAALGLADNAITAQGVLALAHSQRLPALAHLNLEAVALDWATQEEFSTMKPEVRVRWQTAAAQRVEVAEEDVHDDDDFDENGE